MTKKNDQVQPEQQKTEKDYHQNLQYVGPPKTIPTDAIIAPEDDNTHAKKSSERLMNAT